jgi:hypothetical protein
MKAIVFPAALILGARLATAASIDPASAREVLFDATPGEVAADACPAGDDPAAEIECLIRLRYSSDPQAQAMAVDFHRRTGCVPGLLPEEDFDGGYRGIIHLVPALPAGKDRRHLKFVAESLYSYQELFAELEKRSGKTLAYRARDLAFFFFRSQKKRTPAAFAHGWSVGYNVNGSLNHSVDVVRELLFHEIFHLNDHAHGDWSHTALAAVYRSIQKKCGTRMKCLAPYAQGFVKVVGGTYYAFTPGNGVWEYAAELSIQYLREQREIIAGRKVKKPFKCGPPENARAWKLLVDEFFSGVDLVPPCPGSETPKPPR